MLVCCPCPSGTCISCNPALVVTTRMWLLVWIQGRHNTTAKGWCEQSAHPTTVLVKVWLKPSLEETSAYTQSKWLWKLSYSINRGQPSTHRALLHSSRLHTRISSWVGAPLKVTPQGWEDSYCTRYSISEWKINMMKLCNLSLVI